MKNDLAQLKIHLSALRISYDEDEDRTSLWDLLDMILTYADIKSIEGDEMEANKFWAIYCKYESSIDVAMEEIGMYGVLHTAVHEMR
tara:strand:- start:57 stop:317 length:261 start_codon:yes stop_codon:yes gene_type:complete